MIASSNIGNNTQYHQYSCVPAEVCCLVKSELWQKYESIGPLPENFETLIKILSLKYFPNNFVLNYIKDNFTYANIASQKDYNRMMKDINVKSLNEARLFVFVIKKQVSKEKYLPNFEKLAENKDSLLRLNFFRDDKVNLGKKDTLNCDTNLSLKGKKFLGFHPVLIKSNVI